MPTIALVANDRNVMTSVSVVLEAEGYRIAAYPDGASALSDFQTAPPDLAILDIKIPRLDGAEALRLLRAKSDLPVIFLTSTKEAIDEVFALEMGADISSANRSRSASSSSGSRPFCAEHCRRAQPFRRKSPIKFWSAALCAWT